MVASLSASRTVRLATLGGGLLFYVILYAMLWPSAPLATPDTAEYLDLASRLAHGTWTEPHDRMIGYPLFLIPFGAGASPGRLFFYFQLLAHAGGILLLTNALRRLGVSTVLCAAFALLLLTPPFVDEAGTILTECLTGVVLAVMIYCLVRAETEHSRAFLWMAGLCAAFAFLFRPVYLLLGAATIVSWLAMGTARSAWRAIVPLVAPTVLIVSAFVSIQYARTGYLGLNPKSGFMLFTRTVYVLERIPDDHAEIRELLIRHRDRHLTARGSSHTGASFLWGKDDGALTELLRVTGAPARDLSRDMLKLNVNLIALAPLQYAAVVARSMVDSWFPAASSQTFFGSRVVQLIWAALHFSVVLLYLISLCYFITALVVKAAGRYELTASGSLHTSTAVVEAALHLAVWYTCIMSSLVEVGQPRYMLPALPMAVMAVVLFVNRWTDLRRRNAAAG